MIIRATLLIGDDDYSKIVREIVEYVVNHINSNFENYELLIVLKVENTIFNNKPILIVEDLDPIIIDKLPSVETLLNIFMVAGDAKYLDLIDRSPVSVENNIL
ncbi:hypothetical protein [Staphylothermus hellenicus]|uniref:Uncharacterized protein n=1 Tax=Staphylothermus hellenicus (strain DSM 12710 / JCM 10830 / BK20S6-10-b1 / P8) TaxID=591019 RepID=D7DB50_STAHD|nr:hypothetical protein [Staphylothermus hellenicus]ADI31397.1 hypothetical protein Shell_0258 [Staphylothermus hellenicus DSM 12710]